MYVILIYDIGVPSPPKYLFSGRFRAKPLTLPVDGQASWYGARFHVLSIEARSGL